MPRFVCGDRVISNHKQESEFIRLLYQGLSIKAISSVLGLTYLTMKMYAHDIYVKHGVSGSRELLAKLDSLGIEEETLP